MTKLWNTGLQRNLGLVCRKILMIDYNNMFICYIIVLHIWCFGEVCIIYMMSLLG
jgi:hypothetical protein